jgi:hypothetical protein
MLGQLTGTGVVMYVEREGRLAATQFMLGN